MRHASPHRGIRLGGRRAPDGHEGLQRLHPRSRDHHPRDRRQRREIPGRKEYGDLELYLAAQNAGLKWNVEASARGPLPVVSGEKGPDLFHLGVSADEVTRIALQPGIAQFLQGRCA